MLLLPDVKSLSSLCRVVHPWGRRSACVLVLLSCVATTAIPLWGQQTTQAGWPQLLGPTRDGHARSLENSANISGPWPQRLRATWKVESGTGFATPLVVGPQVFLFQRIGDQEGLWCYDLANGKEQWKATWPSKFRGSINQDNGPRSTPAITPGGLAICFGAEGTAACINIRTGDIKWQRPLRKQLSAPDGYFGAGTSPLIVGETAIICAGGKRTGSGVVCLNIETGETIWQATNYESSYASPIRVGPHAKPLILAPMRLNTVLLDATTGEELGEVDFGTRGPTVNAATPINVGSERYWLTSNYGIGSTLIDLSTGSIEVISDENRSLASHYNTPVYADRILFGIDGYEGRGVSLRAINPSTQNVLWQEDNFSTAHLIASGKQIVALTLEGKLRVFAASKTRYAESAQTHLADSGQICRAAPALLGQTLIVRTNSQQELAPGTLARYDLLPRTDQ